MGSLKEAIDKDDARAAMAILNLDRNGLLNHYCVSTIFFLKAISYLMITFSTIVPSYQMVKYRL